MRLRAARNEAPSPARAQRAGASVRRGHRLRFWSDCFIAFDPPRFGMRVANPRLPRRQSHDRLHVGACRVRDRYVVDMEAIDHRREHRIGGGEAPEQIWPPSAVRGARVLPGGFDASDIGPNFIVELDRPDWPAEIHRTSLPPP